MVDNWRFDGLCRHLDPELWFLNSTSEKAKHQISLVKNVCSCCPVLFPCRSWGLATPGQDGIVGGLTAEERRTIRKGKAS